MPGKVIRMDKTQDPTKISPPERPEEEPKLVSRRGMLGMLATGSAALAALTVAPKTWSAPKVGKAGSYIPRCPQKKPVLHSLRFQDENVKFGYSDPEEEVRDDTTYLQVGSGYSTDGEIHWTYALGSLECWKESPAYLERRGYAGFGSISFRMWCNVENSTTPGFLSGHVENSTCFLTHPSNEYAYVVPSWGCEPNEFVSVQLQVESIDNCGPRYSNILIDREGDDW